MGILKTIKAMLFGAGDESPKDQPFKLSPATICYGDLQSAPLAAWGNADIIKGLRFCATMQLRTPLRVLSRHEEFHADQALPPPTIAAEQWEGIWLPQVFDEPYKGDMASDVGPISASAYLPFLVAMREIIEAHDSIERRIERLRGMRFPVAWKVFLEKHDGIEGIICRFFPPFLSTIPGIGQSVELELSELGLDTAGRLADAPDATLLGIKGIGPSRLVKVRAYCGTVAERDSVRLERVSR